MLNLVANIFEQAVDRTNLIERYEGVVTAVNIPQKGGGTERTLVSCTDPTACVSGRYRKAVPDDALRGLAYVEQRGEATTNSFTQWDYRVSYPVRLVFWVNLARQSLTHCSDIIDQATFQMINCLKQEKSLSVSWSTQNIRAEIENIRVVPRTAAGIFSGLPYQDNSALYVWPYAYCAIDAQVNFLVPANCLSAIDPTSLAECPEV